MRGLSGARWAFVLLAVCVSFDVATPQLAGAFRVFDEVPSDVIAAPAAAGPHVTHGGPSRTPARVLPARVRVLARVWARPAIPRSVAYVVRIPQPSPPSDSADAD